MKSLAAIVIVDSNALFTKSDVDLINKEFVDKFLEARKYSKVSLCIPRVCLSEILFQKCSSGNIHINQARKSLRIVGRLTDRNPPGVLDDNSLTRSIARKLLRWCKGNKVLIARVPIRKIDWKQLINSAVRKIPPFSPPSPQQEKGFKDALVLETVVDVCTSYPDSAVSFITADNLLRDAAIKRLSDSKSFAAFQSIEEWLSHLRLAHEKQTSEWANQVLARATSAFYDGNNPECLYLKERVRSQIEQSFSIHLADSTLIHPMNLLVPTTAPLFSLSTGGLPRGSSYGPPPRQWLTLSEDKVWIQPATYLSTDSNKVFHWRSDIVFVRLYQESGSYVYVSPPQYIRRATFAVLWHSKVSADGKLSDVALDKIEYEGSKAELANDTLLNEYGLPNQYQQLVDRLKETSPTAYADLLSPNPPLPMAGSPPKSQS